MNPNTATQCRTDGFVSLSLLIPHPKIQYRCSSQLVAFPSSQFYGGRLRSGLRSTDRIIHPSAFPWPTLRHGQPRPSMNPYPCVFIQCGVIESLGGQSKHNSGQIEIVKAVVKLLNSPPPSSSSPPSISQTSAPSIALLTPYSKQRDALKRLSLPNTTSSTIDGVQGREYDYVVFSTVRCNADGEIGFLRDERRLNVAWTRARYGRIIVGDRSTLEGGEGNEVWKEALKDCEEVRAEDIGVVFDVPNSS